MKNKIVISTDKEEKVPKSGICIWEKADISESESYYLLNNKTVKTKLYVHKDSKEGKDLTNWLEDENNRNNESINKKALELISSQIDVNEIMSIYDIKEEEGYKRGYSDAQYNIRKALGIE